MFRCLYCHLCTSNFFNSISECIDELRTASGLMEAFRRPPTLHPPFFFRSFNFRDFQESKRVGHNCRSVHNEVERHLRLFSCLMITPRPINRAIPRATPPSALFPCIMHRALSSTLLRGRNDFYLGAKFE